MRNRFFLPALTLVFLAVVPARAGEEYSIDPAHTAVGFKISHLGLSWTYGRFNDVAGTFVLDSEAGKCSFNVTIKVASIDTGNQKRDEHLRGEDFFAEKKFPTMSFKSTSVKAVKDGYQVTGDFTLRGVTRSITFTLVGGRTVEFPRGVKRTGFSTELTLKRSDFGMDRFKDAVGDEVYIAISFEGTKK